MEKMPDMGSQNYTPEDLAGMLSVEPGSWNDLELQFPGTKDLVEAVRSGVKTLDELPRDIAPHVRRLMAAHAPRV